MEVKYITNEMESHVSELFICLFIYCLDLALHGRWRRNKRLWASMSKIEIDMGEEEVRRIYEELDLTW